MTGGAGQSRAARLLLLAPQAILILVFFACISALVWKSFYSGGQFSFGTYADILTREAYQRVMIRTVLISLATTALCVLIGYPIAYTLAHSRYRNYLLILLITPWLVSLVVRTFAWMIILGNTGLINWLLMSAGITGAPIKFMFNPVGIVIGLVHVFVPFMVIAILSVLLLIDRSLEEASMSLGAGPARTFLRVVWPLSLPGVFSGIALVYLMSSGAIVTPLLLGGLRDRMMGTQIYQEIFQVFNVERASAMAILLLVSSIVIILPLMMVERRFRRTRGS